MHEARESLPTEGAVVTKVGEVFSIGGVAARFGVSPSAVRRWEAIGLIPPAARAEGSDRRVYLAEDVEAIRERVESRRRKQREEAPPPEAA